MKPSLLFFIYVFVLLQLSDSLAQDVFVKGQGGKYYGGVFKLSEPDYIRTLFPHDIVDAISYRVANNVYEGLMKFDQSDLSVKPGLVESYSIDTSGRVYTFILRRGVVFHDNKCFPDGRGREVTSEDIKFCFTLLCKYNSKNKGFCCFDKILKGANKCYEASKRGDQSIEVEGITIVDRYTIQLKLEQRNTNFLYQLARPFTYIFPKEAYEMYGTEMRVNAVGTGPFFMDKVYEGFMIIQKRNTKYYRKDEYGNKLPYLDVVRISFIRDKKTELLEFKKGSLHVMYRLPTDYIIEIEESTAQRQGSYGEYELQRTPELATRFVGFNTRDPLFRNADLRKAISYSINRKKIIEAVLNGEGYESGKYGFTPLDAFVGYDVKSIQGCPTIFDEENYSDPKAYLKKAGYKSGLDVPRIILYASSDGERNVMVAEEIKKQLQEELDLNIDLEILTSTQLLEGNLSGKHAMFLSGWFADYPDPENFLWCFYGKNVPSTNERQSYPNISRYSNLEFDALYEKALNAPSQQEKYKYLLEAERTMMKDAPIAVLWYDEGYRLLSGNVKGFENNPMQYRDFSKVYFVPKKKE